MVIGRLSPFGSGRQPETQRRAQMPLRFSDVSTFSVRNQSLPFVDACHHRASDGAVFCETKYAFDALLGNGLSRGTKLYDWMSRWRATLLQYGVAAAMVVMGSRVQGELVEHVLESRALLTLFVAVAISTGGVAPPVRAACVRYLATVTTFTMGMPSNNMLIAVDQALTLRVLPTGIVEGWNSFAQRAYCVQFAAIWGSMRSAAYWGRCIGSDFSCPQHRRCTSVLDVCPNRLGRDRPCTCGAWRAADVVADLVGRRLPRVSHDRPHRYATSS